MRICGTAVTSLENFFEELWTEGGGCADHVAEVRRREALSRARDRLGSPGYGRLYPRTCFNPARTARWKSFITHPSPGLKIKGPGFYEISAVPFQKNGRISKVEVSADGGQELGGSGTPGAGSKQSVHPLPYAMELGWEAGGPASKAARRMRPATCNRRVRHSLPTGLPRGTPNVAAFTMEHCNAITSWGIDAKGEVSHVYA